MIKYEPARYDAYKDSGVKWIGEVPEHWQVRRVKELGNLVLGKMLDNKNGEGKLFKNYLKSKNIGWLVPDVSSVEKMYFSLYEIRLYRIKKGDLLFSEGGEVGKTSFWNNDVKECYIQNSVHKLTINNFNYSRYFMYLSYAAGHSGYYDSIVNFVSIKHLTKEKLSRVIWSVPSIIEQKAIADYLDTKTAQIDRKIDLLTQKATQYGKLKQSLINEIVTRGLDKTVAMKDSGVEWIREVPEHWDVKRIKNLSILQSGDSIVSEQIEEEGKYPVYGGNGLRGYYSKYTNNGEYILIGRQGALCGNINYASGKFWASEHAVVAYLKRSIDMKWYGEILRIMNLNQYSLAAAQPGLAMDRIKRLLLPVPPLQEQKTIADYLDTKIAHINCIAETINTQIEKLKELRKTLITDVVTGKIKVVK